jgi:ubiquinone/menaquinone biosynthesis C-methylase UbiE
MGSIVWGYNKNFLKTIYVVPSSGGIFLVYNMSMTQTDEQLSAELYDTVVPDWDGELDFYREFAYIARERGQSVLEVACGTGRVTLRLAREGVNIVGTDLDEEMLNVARRKSEGIPNVGWVRCDMRSLDLGRRFGLILIPGHSFQFMCTPEDQVKALENFHRHLTSDGILIVHVNFDSVSWLGDLLGDLGGKSKQVSEVIHPQTRHMIRKSNAWTYEPSTQTAKAITRWEELSKDGPVLRTWENKPKALHVVFPFEMEHLLARTGFREWTVYGDFFKHPLNDSSSDMIWVAKN